MKIFKEAKQGIALRKKIIPRLDDKLYNLINRFLLFQDIKNNSKITYRESLDK